MVDWISPFVLSFALMISGVQLFRMRRSAVKWYTAYVILVTLASVHQAIMTRWLTEFGIVGVISVVGGLALFLVVLRHVKFLEKQGILN